jgi:hypothetical protein
MGTMNESFRFSGNDSLLFVLAAGVGPLLTHTITDQYNIVEYLMTTLNKEVTHYTDVNVLLIRHDTTYI